MNNIQKIKFSDLFLIPSKNGLTRPTSVRGQGYRMVNMGELFAYSFIGDIPMERVPMNERELTIFTLNAGDLLFARQSLVLSGAGQCSYVEEQSEPTTFESHLIRIRLNPTLADSKFYYYLFKTPYSGITSIVRQCAQAGIRASDLSNLEILYPNLNQQKQIVKIISPYDDLIENNRRRIQLLEEAARLLYQEWFVRLRFPGHEHTKIVDGVPEGWNCEIFPKIVEINPKTKVDSSSTIRYIPMSALNEGLMIIKHEEIEIREKSTNIKFKNNDVLFARITPCLENGKTSFVNYLDESEVACGSTEFIVFRGKMVSPYFVYCLSRTHDFRENAIKSMIGSSGRQRVQNSCFSEYPILLAPQKILDLFDSTIAPLFTQIEILDRENKNLIKARDLLLPRLMNGVIPV
ncbi:restriction endonuclease subunit S [Methanospirillum stamsii]|uniref:Restriction endonuclease subunit S n=1 Tax=Methanospirillum stamsii TaxID=1277351 RepID=A0A2V2MZT1_9EURY|nr:restriction endonuclease subunit S [Methanospirillum stamsii]PWR71845.1 restriction endonuclease subunit S [Methanospirillum stamsii]